MKFGIKLGDIVKINAQFDGNLRNTGRLEFAISAGRDKPSIRKLALLWKAILIDHPFDNGNKRTAEIITRKYARVKNYAIDAEKLVKEVIDVSKNNITDLQKIERRIRYATTGN